MWGKESLHACPVLLSPVTPISPQRESAMGELVWRVP